MAYNHHKNVFSLNDISPLPDRLDALKDQRDGKVGDYQRCVTDFVAALSGKHINQAHALQNRAAEIEQQIDNLTAEFKQCNAELKALVDDKIKDARTMFNKLGKGKSAQLRCAADYLIKAKDSRKHQNLTAALLQAQQCIGLLQKTRRPPRQQQMHFKPRRQPQRKIIHL